MIGSVFLGEYKMASGKKRVRLNLKHRMKAKRHLCDPGGGYFTINSYGGVRRKDFCYDPIPEIWSDIDTQSQNICQILIPNRRSNKNNSTSKG